MAVSSASGFPTGEAFMAAERIRRPRSRTSSLTASLNVAVNLGCVSR